MAAGENHQLDMEKEYDKYSDAAQYIDFLIVLFCHQAMFKVLWRNIHIFFTRQAFPAG